MNQNKQAPRILITTGPAPLMVDSVRRLTNHSTGALGNSMTKVASALGAQITLLRSSSCTVPAPEAHHRIITFTDHNDLHQQFQFLSKETTSFDAVWHAAAVSDFDLDYISDQSGNRMDPDSKIPSRAGGISIHLKPAPKLIHYLQKWFPDADLVGWKYETNGIKHDVLEKAYSQIRESNTHVCVANGPAYGDGFGVCYPDLSHHHCPDAHTLTQTLLRRLGNP